MSDVIIRAADLTKVYRLYSKPHYRFLDMFGLLGRGDAKYTEHRALDGVNLEIRRGEKVAIIGRNGAGKSTLLKLATKVIEPTSGRIEVAEGVHALLQIGSGFHPEFSGRENARSYLAHLGVSGKEADERIREIVEFAELEEYIDQPIKTYSTGMAARLMFATSTAVAPKLLVLDEILGVGDAYFAQKSYERIKELCDTQGSTVLLVSHDVYSAGKLCERMIWIDHGRIVIDGPSPTVLKAYEDSIRLQEERRLREKKRLQLEQSAASDPGRGAYVTIEIASGGNVPLPHPVYFSEVRLVWRDGFQVSAPILDERNRRSGILETGPTDGCWGPVREWEGRIARPMVDHGSVFHKVTAALSVPAERLPGAQPPPEIKVGFWAQGPCDLRVRLFSGGREFHYGNLPQDTRKWTIGALRSGVPTGIVGDDSGRVEFSLSGRHGSGLIAVRDVRVVTAEGAETLVLTHGREIWILIDYQVKNRDLRENAQVLVAFHRDGVQDVCRIVTKELLFDGKVREQGTVRLRIKKLPLANGTYSLSVMVVREGYFDRPQNVFYSINPDVYTSLGRVLEVSVEGGGVVGSGTGTVIEGDWSFLPEQSLVDGAVSSPYP